MKVVAFLPAKGESLRVDAKNTRLLDGKPLFLHTLEKLVSCDFIDEVYLDTESQHIIDLASEVDCKIMLRDPSLANNKTDGNRLFMNEVNHVYSDIYIQILGTSPFISVDTIRKGVDALRNQADIYDSAVLVKKEKQYLWDSGVPTYDIDNIPNSVDLPSSTIETMGLYIVRRDCAIRTRRRIGDAPYLIEATPLDAVDVNWPDEFDLANLIAAGMRESDRKLLANLRGHISSSLLSDLLDDMGFSSQVIKGLSSNIDGVKFLGRAKTLKLRALKDGEDYKGIYHALNSYKTIIPNDIILVENEMPDYAYFGELNANLAIRSGASAVVVGGKTRDSQEVLKTGLPVFSSGYTCQDVRKRATTESINKKIKISGVTITPGDLVFGDSEGVVVIPKNIERKLIIEIFNRASNEKKILVDISMGADVDSLVKNYGFF